METRKEFLKAVMKMANLKDLEQADDAARAVISLQSLSSGTNYLRRLQTSHHLIFVRVGNLLRLLKKMILSVMNAYSKPGRPMRN